ncbi:origin recognition complex subunit 6 (ORC6) domain-containing protein [Ophiocordyceps camponoti-floridani]|uniref:Origin recognition complex subunit 6 (ORC6) domain-containing protein n=1 Tax=Ophiocordyceps camponoti-floridani TaxID=2030778 RepID=A0A8H4VB28_9HYPO|nr:origin recognition complex subunit 6 (ORC6) domain-containing protein [Ophiocordyceps camponoti-floridani]
MDGNTEVSTPKKEPTPSEAMFFFAIVKFTRNKADIDWDAVAKEQGFKSADVARVRFGQIKRKLGINSNMETTPASSARTSTKKRDAASSALETPTKAPKRINKGKTETPTKPTADSEETPVKKTPTKAGKKTPGRGGARAGSRAKAIKQEEDVEMKDELQQPQRTLDEQYGMMDRLLKRESPDKITFDPPCEFDEAMKMKEMFTDDHVI